jgi:hypothetical protein
VIGHNEGTFIYNNDTFNKINEINGGWNMVKSGWILPSNLWWNSFYNKANDLKIILLLMICKSP